MSPTLPERLSAIQESISSACARSGRSPEEVTLLGVSKRQPLERMREALAAGLRTFGENQVQEAVRKSAELPPDVDWHFIGHLQSNKAKPAARLFSTIHSVDRLKIARHLDKESRLLGRRLRVFLEVNLGAETNKHGFGCDELTSAIGPLRALEGLEFVGLMAIPPYEQDLERARQWFRRLRELRDDMTSRWDGFPGMLSMGMSHDFEVAIEEGATHVRVGTSLFGPRPLPRERSHNKVKGPA